MRQLVTYYQVFLDWLEKLTLAAAMALLAALLTINSVDIIYEQVSGNSLVWIEEVDNLIFAWLIFLGAGVISRRGLHIGVDVAYDLAGPRLRAVFRLIYLALALIICWVMVFYGIKMALFVGRYQTSLYLDINLFYYYLAIPAGGVLLALNSIGATLPDPRHAEEGTPAYMETVL